jgi:hypothetical protein
MSQHPRVRLFASPPLPPPTAHTQVITYTHNIYKRVCVCVCVRERERVCVCVRCVCERERERERESETESERELFKEFKEF